METTLINILGVDVNAFCQGSNFSVRISREECLRLLNTDLLLPFEIMCAEYGEDDDWIGVSHDDLESITEFEEYETFEIWVVDMDFSTLPPYYVEGQTEEPTGLKAVNQQLLNALDALVSEHGEGRHVLNQNTRDYIEYDADYIRCCYFGEKPDGDQEEKIYSEWVNEGKPVITDEDAYNFLQTRICNTII
jgi:hypothetical protein